MKLLKHKTQHEEFTVNSRCKETDAAGKMSIDDICKKQSLASMLLLSATQPLSVIMIKGFWTQ